MILTQQALPDWFLGLLLVILGGGALVWGVVHFVWPDRAARAHWRMTSVDKLMPGSLPWLKRLYHSSPYLGAMGCLFAVVGLFFLLSGVYILLDSLISSLS